MKVIPHPIRPGHWTILIDGGIYGCYERKALAIAVMLTR
jgi:hypothetical protein